MPPRVSTENGNVMSTDYAPEITDNGVKEPRTIRMKFGNGPEWAVPVDVIRAVLYSAWDENSAFMGRHLQAALTGEMPKGGRRGSGTGTD
jgi:hypothetical protein